MLELASHKVHEKPKLKWLVGYWIYLTRSLLNFLDLLMFLYHIWEMFNHYPFKYLFCFIIALLFQNSYSVPECTTCHWISVHFFPYFKIFFISLETSIHLPSISLTLLFWKHFQFWFQVLYFSVPGYPFDSFFSFYMFYKISSIFTHYIYLFLLTSEYICTTHFNFLFSNSNILYIYVSGLLTDFSFEYGSWLSTSSFVQQFWLYIGQYFVETLDLLNFLWKTVNFVIVGN